MAFDKMYFAAVPPLSCRRTRSGMDINTKILFISVNFMQTLLLCSFVVLVFRVYTCVGFFVFAFFKVSDRFGMFFFVLSEVSDRGGMIF